jgi:hypothetical protein
VVQQIEKVRREPEVVERRAKLVHHLHFKIDVKITKFVHHLDIKILVKITLVVHRLH